MMKFFLLLCIPFMTYATVAAQTDIPPAWSFTTDAVVSIGLTPEPLYIRQVFNDEPGAPGQDIIGLGFRTDGRIVTMSPLGKLHIWHARSGIITEAFQLPLAPENRPADNQDQWFHHTGTDWAVTTSKDSLFVVSLLDGSISWSTQLDTGVSFSKITVSGDGTKIAVQARDSAYIWDTRTTTRSTAFVGDGILDAFSLSRDGSELRIISLGNLRRYRIENDRTTLIDTMSLAERFDIPPAISSAAWSDDNRYVVISSQNDTLYSIDYGTLTLQSRMPDPCGIETTPGEAADARMKWMVDGRRFVVWHQHALSLVDPTSTKPPIHLEEIAHSFPLLWYLVALAPDGIGIAAVGRRNGTERRSIYSWDKFSFVSVPDESQHAITGLTASIDASMTTMIVTIPEGNVGGVIRVMDISGSVVTSCPTSMLRCEIPVASLASGIYGVVLDGPSGRLATHCVLAR